MTTLTALGWLAGCWRTADGVSEECWLAPRGELMLGVHRDVRPDRPVFHEALRIELQLGAVVYVASPKGQATTTFTLSESTEHGVVFSNPTHDFPQHIAYERDGDTLTATIRGTSDGVERSSTWTFLSTPFPLTEPGP